MSCNSYRVPNYYWNDRTGGNFTFYSMPTMSAQSDSSCFRTNMNACSSAVQSCSSAYNAPATSFDSKAMSKGAYAALNLDHSNVWRNSSCGNDRMVNGPANDFGWSNVSRSNGGGGGMKRTTFAFNTAVPSNSSTLLGKSNHQVLNFDAPRATLSF